MRNSPNRIVATVFGAVYVLVGLLGFAVTGGVGFIATEGGLLLGVFQVNPLHNIAHLLIGAALLIAGFANASRRQDGQHDRRRRLPAARHRRLLPRRHRGEHPRPEHRRPLPAPRERHRAARRRTRGRAVRTRGDGLGSLAMTALTTMARTWPMLAAFGGGLVLLALAAGAGGTAGGVLAAAGIAGLGWGVFSLHAGRAIVPRDRARRERRTARRRRRHRRHRRRRGHRRRGRPARRGIRVHRGRRRAHGVRGAATSPNRLAPTPTGSG